jgi:hypothetical protein
MTNELFRIDFDRKIIKPGTKVLVRVHNVDNEAEVKLNNHVVYRRSLHNDPPLKDVVELTQQLTVGKNYLNVRLLNWSGGGLNPWHIAYTVVADEAPLIEVDARSAGTAVAGLAYQNDHEIVVTK